MQRRFSLEGGDGWMALAVFVLFALGLVALWTLALSGGAADMSLVVRQAFAAALGLLLSLAIFAWDARRLQSYAGLLGACGALLLLAVLLLGVERRGTVGWFDFGIASFQPVEFSKIALVVFLASLLARRTERRVGAKLFFLSAVPLAIYVLLVSLQPDFGSAALMVAVWGAMLYVAGLDRRWIAGGVGASIVSMVAGWFFFFKEYQKQRLLTFFNPELDLSGQGYNVLQAKIAVGSGRWTGRGLGQGTQSQLQFLPEAHTDFLFAALAEGLGFVGVALVLAALACLLWRVFRLVFRARDDFSAFLSFGLGALLFVQAGVNVAMNLGVFPVTGLPLPFVSYGGSSLLAAFVIFGILQSLARHAVQES